MNEVEKKQSNQSSVDERKPSESHPAVEVADQSTIRMAAEGDMAAFEEIYWKYNRKVFGISLRMCGNPADAEDLTQQVFVQLFRKLAGFRGESAFSSWLYRLTVNTVLMHFRKQKTLREETNSDGDVVDAATAPRNRRLGEQIYLETLVRQLVGKLPDGYRKMLILHDVCGYEHDEIAEMLSCSPGTSKSQLFKARRKLRSILSADDRAGRLQIAGR